MQRSCRESGYVRTSWEGLRPPHQTTTKPSDSSRKRVPCSRPSQCQSGATNAERLSPRMLLLLVLVLLPCIASRGLTFYSRHNLHFVRTIRLCVVLVDSLVLGEVSTRALRLEPDRFGGPLSRGLPGRGSCWGYCKACTYCPQRSALDLLQCISERPKEI